MFCPKCGTRIEDGSAICPVCGARIEEKPAPAAQTDQTSRELQSQSAPPQFAQYANRARMSAKKKIVISAIALAVAAAITVTIVLVATAGSPKSVVKGFMNAIENKNWEKAGDYLATPALAEYESSHSSSGRSMYLSSYVRSLNERFHEVDYSRLSYYAVQLGSFNSEHESADGTSYLFLWLINNSSYSLSVGSNGSHNDYGGEYNEIFTRGDWGFTSEERSKLDGYEVVVATASSGARVEFFLVKMDGDWKILYFTGSFSPDSYY